MHFIDFSMFTLKEESKKIRADAKLDINLERSRVTDMVCIHYLLTFCANLYYVYIFLHLINPIYILFPVYRTREETDGS